MAGSWLIQGNVVLANTFLEAYDRDFVVVGKAIDLADELLSHPRHGAGRGKDLAPMKTKERRRSASVLQTGLINVQVHAVDSFDFQHHVILNHIGNRFGYTHVRGLRHRPNKATNR